MKKDFLQEEIYMILLNNQSSKRGLNTSNTNIRMSDVFCWEDRGSSGISSLENWLKIFIHY